MRRSPGILLALVLPVVPGTGVVVAPPAAAPAPAVATRLASPARAGVSFSAPCALIEPPAREPEAAPEANVQDPEAIARRADQALAALRALRATFVQEVRNPLLEKTTTGRGVLLYRTPDRFRIAYSDPPGDVVVNDGSRVWIYLPSSQPGQVLRQPAESSGVRNPLTYLRDLRSQYTVRYAGAETVSGHAADRLDLLPRADRAAFTRVEVWVDRETGLLRRARTRAEDGVVTTYTFTTLERNARIDAGFFRFTPPRGVEVFDS